MIGRTIDPNNIVPATPQFLQSMMATLFATDFAHFQQLESAIIAAEREGTLEWAAMATIKGKHRGYRALCTRCGKLARVSWHRTTSTEMHMQIQRATLLAFLNCDFRRPGSAMGPREV